MKTCDTCAHYLPPERPTPKGQTFFIATCTHKALRNPHGPIATTVARSSFGGCGEDAIRYRPARGE